MKLLVSGGAGFIGSNFIRYWRVHHPDDQIIIFDALTYAGHIESLHDVLGDDFSKLSEDERHNVSSVGDKNSQVQFIKGDITDAPFVNIWMEGVDVVAHFAAESHVDRSITGPADFIKTNVVGTQILLDISLKKNVKRFHHISTDEVFGSLELESKEKFSEMTRYNPRSPYAASKAASDHLVRAYHTTYGLPITITNCSNNFGPYHHPEKLIPLAITNILEGKKVPVYGDGLYVRDWLYVEDHCRAIEQVLTKGKIGETYCVGGLTEDINNFEVIKRILRIMGKDESSIEFVRDRPGHDRRYSIDWSKIKNELGWEPQHDFDTWLGKTIEWFKNNEDWWKRVKSGEYREYYEKQYHS